MEDFNIHEDGNKVLTESVLNGIDVNDMLYDVAGTIDYTTPKDCILILQNRYTSTFTIDDISINRHKYNVNFISAFPLKKGQRIVSHNTAQEGSATIYGIKR